jgi:hypothetical protein
MGHCEKSECGRSNRSRWSEINEYGFERQILSGDDSCLATVEQRLTQLGIKLQAPPEPFGIYAEAVQTGNLLFLTGMLPTEAAKRNSSGASVRNWTSKRATRRLAWPP